MIDLWKVGGRSLSQQWSRAMQDAFIYPWNIFDAQCQTGLRMMESLLGKTRGVATARVPAASETRPSPKPLPQAKSEAVFMAQPTGERASKIQDKVAIVTGAASGIGEAVARELALRGARAVILVDRSDRVHGLVEAVNGSVGRPVVEAMAGDVTSDAFRTGAFDQVIARHGVVQICVPAAGITRDALAVKVDKATGQASVYPAGTFREVVEVNLIAPVYWALEMVARIARDRCSRGLGRWEPAEGVQGTIVFIGSVSSQGNKGQISYAATKAGLEGAAATLMKEAIYHGVRCGVIHPGFTDTPMVRALGEEYIKKNVLPYTQLRRLIRPEEIADAICFMINNSAVSGELWADAGWHPSA
jgi:NAD(P)-dependent dehydrogenase (short-subunit alcohol dehydrogenase family)